MKILITYALDAERGALSIPDHQLFFCPTGMGKVSAALKTYEAALHVKPDLVLNIGSAGTLHYQVGDIVPCVRFLDRDLEKNPELGVAYWLDFSDEMAAFSTNTVISGAVSTGDTFQTDFSESSSGNLVDVFDMEAFGSAQACKMLGFPFFSVKYVTDVIGQNSVKHWEEKLHDSRLGLERFLQKIQISR
jgi:adenosylhomocysteine nucleosidase